VADRSAGLTSPHPNFGCVIARPQLETDDLEAWVAGEGFLYAQGTTCAELLAAQEAGEHARGATAYLNLEPGDCYGDSTAVSSLVQVLHSTPFPISVQFLLRDTILLKPNVDSVQA
jgi:diaminohydroxyphosphoribosylaminopyrimidine deaminase/5-amino-6-(5-phosphoribosylamino)uracil reductase